MSAIKNVNKDHQRR